MVSHQPPKISGHRHCSSRDIMLLVFEEQDYTCSLKSAITFISKAQGIQAHDMSC